MAGWFIIATILVGWLCGVLINYCADVLPVTRRFQSVLCDKCQQSIQWVDFFLMRPCQQCAHPRSIRSWIVQISAVMISILLGFYPIPSLGYGLSLALLTYFGLVVVIDIEHHLILHPVSLVGGILCIAIGITERGFLPTLLGGICGFLIMFGIYGFGWIVMGLINKVRKQKVEEEALGFGDIIQCTVLGFLLGWPGVILEVFFTIFIAGAASLIILVWQMLRKRYQMFSAVAFGPYLILAAILVLILKH